MKVILLQDIKGMGKKHDIKEVKSGYARNFLIPKKLVLIATQAIISKIEHLKADEKEKQKKFLNELEKKAEELPKLNLKFCLKTGEHNEIFGSVTKHNIEKALETKGFYGARANLEKPIKILGIQDVEVDLGKGVKTRVRVEVEGDVL